MPARRLLTFDCAIGSDREAGGALRRLFGKLFAAGESVGKYLAPAAGAAESKKLFLVRPERFELPTTRFEAECSIQLSYGRVAASLTET